MIKISNSSHKSPFKKRVTRQTNGKKFVQDLFLKYVKNSLQTSMKTQATQYKVLKRHFI